MKKWWLICAVAVVAATAYTQNWRLVPNFGTVDLAAGFTPDPHTVRVVPGGDIDLSTVFNEIGIRANGYISDAPDLDLNYEAGSFPLKFRVVGGEIDTVLLVNDPNGNWHYNDDTHGLDPEITLQNPMSGMYNIWVGTYEPESAGTVTLMITEM